MKYKYLKIEIEILRRIIGDFIRIVSGKTENYKRDDEDIELLINHLIKCEAEQKEIESTIEAIPDPILKATFKEKYIHGKSWEQVAESIGYSSTHIQRIFKKALQDPEILKIKMELE